MSSLQPLFSGTPEENRDDKDPAPDTPSTSTPTSATEYKLRKIPPIPIRRVPRDEDVEFAYGKEAREEEDEDTERSVDDSSILLASSLGLNQIRTRLAPSPLWRTTSVGTPSNLGNDISKVEDRVDGRPKSSHQIEAPLEQGKRVLWSQSKSLKAPSPLIPVLEGNHAAFAREMQSPRFQAILRVTSGRRKRNSDIKSFSHELNSKGVRPFPVWKHRAFGHMEEIMVAIRAKFDKLKEEVDSDLGAFAGDLVGTLDKTSTSHPEWRESLEDLLVVARQCAKMLPNEFWLKCEGIVQNLDDRRQDLPMGILKQAHTCLLFFLTRCTWLVQFQKESGYEEDHILGLHKLSDLGVYPEKTSEAVQHASDLLSGNDGTGKQKKKSHGKEQGKIIKHEQVDQHGSDGAESMEVGTATSADSTASSYRMSSWKKLPPGAGKNRKGKDAVETPSKDRLDHIQVKDETEIPDIPSCHPEHSEPSSGVQRASLGLWGDPRNVTYENSMICRICEVEIPIVHMEEHSRICTVADRCDLKGLTVNERLERVAETIEKILESWTPKSNDTPGGSFEASRMSTSSIHEEFDELSPRQNVLSRKCSENTLDCAPGSDNTFLMDELNVLPDSLKPNQGTKGSSAGSLTPQSPLLTPRTSQIEILLSGRTAISELENYQQINKLVEIARAVANVNNCEYSALEFMLDRLEDLKYAIQDRKVDALVVETFGRCIEKLLQEKYVYLCGQIEDEKIESTNGIADEESSVKDDIVRSLRASPINPCSKDRTSIEDFEIIRPISRGAFGRVFLARKRSTGDLFAIKVLKKADMILKNAVESILAERNILISVRNPFVVRFFYSFTCRDNLYLVMEYLNGGDLYSLLRNLGCLDEDMARVYIAEVVLALEYLHSLNVIHRD
ncbi:putative Kinase [Quillaja saponaria]|uniref:non-specific serine/threonine protein kinase n=1 Tax=Quillaja saponaria TaxID=32244 RepID=A0AAD7L113_QUISA|nr:putative Kinase [Quillaja saponaria]